jgi:hypothetical protein
MRMAQDAMEEAYYLKGDYVRAMDDEDVCQQLVSATGRWFPAMSSCCGKVGVVLSKDIVGGGVRVYFPGEERTHVWHPDVLGLVGPNDYPEPSPECLRIREVFNETPAPPGGYSEGSRVLVRFRESHHHLFRGTVTGVTPGGVHTVTFDDQDQIDVPVANIRPFLDEELPLTLPEIPAAVEEDEGATDDTELDSMPEEHRHGLYAEAIRQGDSNKVERLIVSGKLHVDSPLLSLSTSRGTRDIR